MQQSKSRPIPLLIGATLIFVCAVAPSGLAQTPPAATPTPPAAAPTPPAAAPTAPAATPAPPAGIQLPSAGTEVPPATPPLTEAELKKLDDLIAQQGKDIAVTPIITEILGLTKGDQAMTCRAFAAIGEGNEVHQIYLLPDGKGYLAAHFYKDKLDVYSVDKTFGLVAALEGVRGQYPAPTTFADAQYGYHFEQAWWAKYADTH
jgi:hypothetical protein